MEASSLLYGQRLIISERKPSRARPALWRVMAEINELIYGRFGSSLSLSEPMVSNEHAQALVVNSREHSLALSLISLDQTLRLDVRLRQHNDDRRASLAAKLAVSLDRHLLAWGISEVRNVVDADFALVKHEIGRMISFDAIGGYYSYPPERQMALLVARAYQRQQITKDEFLSLLEGPRWSRDGRALLCYLMNAPSGRRALAGQLLAVRYRTS